MPAYLKKSKTEVLNQALTKLQKHSKITAVSPGTVARALAEAVTSELGDMYDVLDFNINQTLVTTASGSALDLLGNLYNTKRKKVSDLAATDKKLGSFIFYLRDPFTSDITIPKGTNIYTDATSYTGQRFSYYLTEDAIIPRGRTRVYASITPNFSENLSTAAVNSLVVHDFLPPGGTTVFCTNPKAISPRTTDETDEQFRARIIKSIRVAASGTAEAIRFAGLNVPGIRDIRMRQAPYGMGSVEAIIVPERVQNADQIFGQAVNAMSSVRSAGIKLFTKAPRSLPFSVELDIIAPSAIGDQVKDVLTKRASVGVSRYVNSLLPGSEFVYNQFLQLIMDSSELVKDVVVKSFNINGQQVMRRNYRPAEDEQIVLGTVNINVARA